MTTLSRVDAPRSQPSEDRSRATIAREVSIHDYMWAAQPKIFSQYVLVPNSSGRPS